MASTSISAMFSTAGAAEDSDLSPPPSDNELDGPLTHKGTDPTPPNIASTSACTANTMPLATGNLTTGLAKSKKKGSTGKKTCGHKNGFRVEGFKLHWSAVQHFTYCYCNQCIWML